jgi:hypothetical protein
MWWLVSPATSGGWYRLRHLVAGIAGGIWRLDGYNPI